MRGGWLRREIISDGYFMSFEKFTPEFKGLADVVNKTVYESGFINEDYNSTLGCYGGKIKKEGEKIIWDNTGFISKLDKFGDAILRTYDDHLVKNPWELFKNHPKAFFKFLAPGTKKYRGSKEEIFENIQRLGLEDTYGLHEQGIEIKDQALFLKGIPLQDVYRSDLIDSEKIQGLDRFQALAESGQYIRKIHNERGAIGELASGDIIFKKYENGLVSEPVLNIPDIVFNKEKEATISDKNKKASDILDLIINIGAEEYRRSDGDLDSVRNALKTLLENYGDNSIISLVGSYIKRGRLVLSGDQESKDVNLSKDTFTTKNRGVFALHNKARQIVNSTELEVTLKSISLELCRELGQLDSQPVMDKLE